MLAWRAVMRRSLAAAVLALVLAVPAVAHADAFDDVFADYQRDGQISPCKHSEAELRQAKSAVPNDIEQYAPDFPDALDQALEARARGGCGQQQQAAAPPVTTATPTGGNAPTPAPAPAASTTPAAPSGSVPQPPGTATLAGAADDGAIVNAASRQAAARGDAPAPLIVLAVLGALLLLGLLAWGVARFFAWDPRWLASTRHAVAEAGWHAGAAWADFTDWLRRGRAT